MKSPFYQAFTARYRGSRNLIKSRLQTYIPFITPFRTLYPGTPALDIGCGRGEWLEIMQENGFNAYGIELDEQMLTTCVERGLSAELGDGICFLANVADESQTVVSAFHVAEHLDFERLQALVSETLRVLKPGGLLILETPNPENIVVASQYFYLDPSHQRPLPSQLLDFLVEFTGFNRAKTVYLQESQIVATNPTPSLMDVLSGVSPDYAIIAQKTAPQDILAHFDRAFTTEHGLTLDTLAARFDARLQQAEVKAQQAEVKAQQAEVKAQQAEVGLHALYNSRSWRITAPLRWLGKTARWFIRGSIAWLTFTPMSRPHRITRHSLILLKRFISARPHLKLLLLRLLTPFPKLRARLQMVGYQPLSGECTDEVQGALWLPPHARQLHKNLKTALMHHHKEPR